jgi:hypothetical protein
LHSAPNATSSFIYVHTAGCATAWPSTHLALCSRFCNKYLSCTEQLSN